MPAPSWDNLDAFLQPDDFARTVNVTPQGGVSRDIKGIFDEPYFNTQIGEYEADAFMPRVTCKASDVADLRAKDAVQVGGKTYYLLTGPQPDGTGMAVLSLATE
ncbi:head-tail joining protein [Pseudophaeobacter sp.]|jgi:hypothetical protein|uniref:head-tail joining protein n=1 Tax=Pseudophaeobacter sp. TaxID=1971739 RepID=UPI0032D96E74